MRTNAEAVRELGKHGVITEPLAEAVIRAVALRNFLVHRDARGCSASRHD
jgi:uncharacterized protein YutE (UPF0331/DUF86 family)